MCEGPFLIFKNLLSWRDILDLTLLIVLFYVFLTFTARYRLQKVLILIFGFLALWGLADILKLQALGWLLNQFWTVLLFAVIVIFQPELRRLFQSLGGRSLFSQRYSKAKVVKKIIKAIVYMAEKQIGALIIFERNVPVETVSEGCVKIDGLVSPELLITIFYPLTPLHDGAVIIKGNRIAFASCVLPLAKGVEFDSKLGTRHRAAIGVTQETDAIAVVVSEETGSISVAIGGKLFRNLSEEELKELLYKELAIEEKD